MHNVFIYRDTRKKGALVLGGWLVPRIILVLDGMEKLSDVAAPNITE
jgi:hypothetical protein